MRNNSSYTTANEMAFIDRIGKDKANRIELLKKYVAAGNNREWGDIDKRKIMQHANRLIRLLEKKAIR